MTTKQRLCQEMPAFTPGTRRTLSCLEDSPPFCLPREWYPPQIRTDCQRLLFQQQAGQIQIEDIDLFLLYIQQFFDLFHVEMNSSMQKLASPLLASSYLPYMTDLPCTARQLGQLYGDSTTENTMLWLTVHPDSGQYRAYQEVHSFLDLSLVGSFNWMHC